MATAAPGLSITPENQNFYRLIRLLVTTGTNVLRHIMEQRATVTYTKATFQEVLDDPNVKKILTGLHPADPKKKKVINASQWNLLYPATGDSDTKSYDISLLMISIRNVCGFPKNFKWDSLPASGDTSLEANIARLKFTRNEVCMHSSSAAIDDKNFHKYFDETKSAILDICTHLQPHQQVSARDIEQLRTEITTDPRLWKQYKDLGNQWAEDERNIKIQLHAIEGRTKDTHEIVKDIKKTLTEVTEKVESAQESTRDKLTEQIAALNAQMEKVLPTPKMTSNDIGEMKKTLTKIAEKVENIPEGMNQSLAEHMAALTAHMEISLKNLHDVSEASDEKEKAIEKRVLFDKKIKEFIKTVKDFYFTHMSEIEVLDEEDRVPMDDIHVTLSWSQLQNLANIKDKKRELQNYLEMFNIPSASDKRLARQILVEGTVGMGKSVFSQKICIDWSRGGCEVLNRFQILLRISLAEVEEHATLQEVIFSQIQVDIDDDTKNDIMSYIQDNQSKILLVLDGYDEYSDKNQHINKILARSILRDCCVIITSRPWKTADEKSFKHYDLFLELEGFKQEASIREFTVKFMKLKSEVEEVETLTERFITQLKKQNLLSFVQAPFLLVISCLLFLENRYHIPERVTEMYQILMDLMFDRCEKRNKNQHIDRHAILLSLGKLSYETLVSDQPLLFKKGDIRKTYGDVVFDAGFLSQHKYRSRKGQYMVSFPHKSFAEYIAAYYVKHEEGQLDRFTQLYLPTIHSVAKFENVVRFSCGLLQEKCRPVLQHLIDGIRWYQEREHLYINDPIEHKQLMSPRDVSVYSSILLLQCAYEGNYKWPGDELTVSFLVVNEDTYRMILLNVKLCVQAILISGLEASLLRSIQRRMAFAVLDKVILENQTDLKEFRNLCQQSERPKTIEIRHSKISSLQDIEYLKCHPALNRLVIDDLELTKNERTPAAVNVVSQTNIKELVIIRSSPSVTKYFLEDEQILKKLVQITTAGQDMMRLLAAKTLKMTQVIEVDNATIQKPENHVNMKEFMKLTTLNPTITKMILKHCHVVMSKQSTSEDECSEGQKGLQSKKLQDFTKGMQTYQQNESMNTTSVTNILFDECSFVDEMEQGFQQWEIFEKLLVLIFYHCTLPLPLLCLLGKTLSKLKHLQMLEFICRREINNNLKYLTESIDFHSQWKYMKYFRVIDGITLKEDMTAMMSMVKLMPNLIKLRMYNTSSDVISSVQQDTIEPFLNQGIPCVHITELDIGGLNLTGRMEDVLHTIKHLQRLGTLYMEGNSFDDRDASTLLHFIENYYKKTVGAEVTVLPNLKTIFFGENNISFEMKNQLIEKAKMKSLIVRV